MMGRPGDPVMAYATEKSNCTQVAEMVFDRLGLTKEATRPGAWIQDYRWGPYTRRHAPPTVDAIRRAVEGGQACLKFVRDPVDRFRSMVTRYRKHGILQAPDGLSVDGLLDWLEDQNLLRYSPGCVWDMHVATQRFFGDTDDLWTEIIHVEDFRRKDVREHLRERYGLRVDPAYTSVHWERQTVDLTPEQRDRVLRVYAVDADYAYP